jgi:hypothetical protein
MYTESGKRRALGVPYETGPSLPYGRPFEARLLQKCALRGGRAADLTGFGTERPARRGSQASAWSLMASG